MVFSRYTMVIAAGLAIFFAGSRDFSATAQSEVLHNLNSVDYTPQSQSVDLWIKEALSLGEDITSNGNIYAGQKADRFHEIIGILVVIGDRYPRYKEYYRDILVNDTSTKKKVLIASVLAAIKDEQLSDILIDLLDDKNPANRAAAILYYQDMRDEDAMPKLEEITKSDPDIRIKILAANALRTIRSSAAAKKGAAG
jgi:hypothetical protein